MSSLKLLHSGGNGVIISAPSSNPAANRTITLNDNYAGNGSFVTANSSGNVGIGTASPTGDLHIQSSNEYCLKINKSDSTAAYMQFYNSTTGSSTSDGFRLGMDSNEDALFSLRESGNMKFATANTERMRFTSGGKFYVGTTNGAFGNDASQHSAIVNSTANEYTLSLRNTVDANTGRTLLCACGKSTGGSLIAFERADGTGVGSITHNGSATAFNTSSDYRLKENVTAISDGITRLKTLKPSRFNFKDSKDITVDGFLAHEVTAVPEAITGTKDEVDSDNKPVYQGIDQSKLVPLLTAALQEEVAKREALEARVAALEAA